MGWSNDWLFGRLEAYPTLVLPGRQELVILVLPGRQDVLLTAQAGDQLDQRHEQ